MANDRIKFVENNHKKPVYGSNVFRNIISLAVKETPGIVSLHGRGVRFKVTGKDLIADVYVKTWSNIKCRDMAFSVQENIKNKIESSTDFIVKEININVLSVENPKEEKSTTEPSTKLLES